MFKALEGFNSFESHHHHHHHHISKKHYYFEEFYLYFLRSKIPKL